MLARYPVEVRLPCPAIEALLYVYHVGQAHLGEKHVAFGQTLLQHLPETALSRRQRRTRLVRAAVCACARLPENGNRSGHCEHNENDNDPDGVADPCSKH